ncbi:MAG: glycosyltransferase [Bacteroidia bacterium]|nr:glycosyltransferase [Bacteroidia bacterium]MCZ2248757.1 glycosyltransferase [Bacteroidia bacterium]
MNNLIWHDIVFGVFVFATAIQLFYYLYFYIRVGLYSKTEYSSNLPPVSIVICAKNEAANLQKNIPLLFQQDYPLYQVVVVNDCSVDESSLILEQFQATYSNLHVVELDEEVIKTHDKKLALTLGIKGAKYEHLLLTDADCMPASNKWIANMVRNFNENKEIIIGYGPYKRAKGLLNRLIRFDAFFIGLQYLSYSIAGNTYMGTGRNLAYTKTLFFRNKGFASQYHIQSGDDDLFVNKVSTPQNTSVELSHESFTYSNSKTTLRTWLRQKRRHVTTAKHYKLNHKILLLGNSLSQYLFYLSFIALLFSTISPEMLFTVFGLKLVTCYLVLHKSMKRLNEMDLFLFSLFFELILLIIYPIIFIGNIFVKNHKWK